MNWEIDNNFLYLNDSSLKKKLMHSRKLESEMLSFSYWDYLAWAPFKLKSENILLLGLGGGTVLQLMRNWGFSPECLGIDLDNSMITSLEKNGWYSGINLKVITTDALQYIEEADKLDFDAIIVDLYDSEGYVIDAYNDNILQKIILKAKESCILCCHCFEPWIKYLALGLPTNENHSSPSISLYQNARKKGLFASFYPLWTSSLVAISKNEDIIKLLENEDMIVSDSCEINWFSTYILKKSKIFNQIEYLHTSDDSINYSYNDLYEVDRKDLIRICGFLNENESIKLLKKLSIKKSYHDYDTGHSSPKGGRDIILKMKLFESLVDFLLIQNLDGNKNLIDKIIIDVCSANKNEAMNNYVNIIISFIYAKTGRYKLAMDCLHEIIFE